MTNIHECPIRQRSESMPISRSDSRIAKTRCFSPVTAEKMLWRAVLNLAVIDFAYFGYERRSDLALARRSAATWFISNDRGLGSFLYVCDVLSINPTWFRKQLFATSVDALKDRLFRQHRYEGKLPNVAASE